MPDCQQTIWLGDECSLYQRKLVVWGLTAAQRGRGSYNHDTIKGALGDVFLRPFGTNSKWGGVFQTLACLANIQCRSATERLFLAIEAVEQRGNSVRQRQSDTGYALLSRSDVGY